MRFTHYYCQDPDGLVHKYTFEGKAKEETPAMRFIDRMNRLKPTFKFWLRGEGE